MKFIHYHHRHVERSETSCVCVANQDSSPFGSDNDNATYQSLCGSSSSAPNVIVGILKELALGGNLSDFSYNGSTIDVNETMSKRQFENAGELEITVKKLYAELIDDDTAYIYS